MRKNGVKGHGPNPEVRKNDAGVIHAFDSKGVGAAVAAAAAAATPNFLAGPRINRSGVLNEIEQANIQTRRKYKKLTYKTYLKKDSTRAQCCKTFWGEGEILEWVISLQF